MDLIGFYLFGYGVDQDLERRGLARPRNRISFTDRQHARENAASSKTIPTPPPKNRKMTTVPGLSRVHGPTLAIPVRTRSMPARAKPKRTNPTLTMTPSLPRACSPAAHAESVLENLAFASCLAKHLPGSATYAEPITYYSYFRATSGSTRMARRAGM